MTCLNPLTSRNCSQAHLFDVCKQSQPFARRLGIDIVVKEDLRERLVAKEIMAGFYEIWRKSWEDFSFALPGCESSFAAQNRFVAVVIDILSEHTEKTIGISTHGNVMGLFLNYIDRAFVREQAEQLKNPDVVRVVAGGDGLVWDREFHVPGLEGIATDHKETPVGSRYDALPPTRDAFDAQPIAPADADKLRR